MASMVYDEDRLRHLNHCGLKINNEGQVVDWQDRPACNARPLMGKAQASDRARRHRFSDREDELVKIWCRAAHEEGVVGTRVFEELEVICPLHPWQAYQSRWQKRLKSESAALPSLVFERPFPSLDSPTGMSGDPHGDPGEPKVQPELSTIEPEFYSDQRTTGESNTALNHHDTTYSDQRIDIDRVLFEKLNLADEYGLCRLLHQPWVIEVYRELLETAQLDDNRLAPRSTPSESYRSQLYTSKSHHQWKLDRVRVILESPQMPSRYTTESPDKLSWTEDEHDIRFLVRAVALSTARGAVWSKEEGGPVLACVCDRAFWLLQWFKWLHKSTSGKGKDAQRLQRKRERWTNHMADLLSQLSHEAEDATALQTSGLEGKSARRHRQEDTYNQMYLLEDDARVLYTRNRNRMLASWGVTTQHTSTCVLLPTIWASTPPEALVDSTEAWITHEPSHARLCLSLGVFKMAWARAAAWFEDWPRDLDALQHFLPPSAERDDAKSPMQGSHLCHHGLCIVPSHITYEDGRTNLSREGCAKFAASCRAYKMPIPAHCNKHEPPCMLQLAALTSFETCAIQFDALRLARDLPARPPVECPVSHHFDSFRCTAAHEEMFPTVGVCAEDLVRIKVDGIASKQRGFRSTCHFCPFSRNFSSIVTFWAHLKIDHSDQPTHHILGEVTKSARKYQAWGAQRFYDLSKSNDNTWQKVVQAQADDFTWDVFANWRLTRARIYEGRAEQYEEDDGTA